ncbi:hypothetical protein AB4Y36_39080 [Paraburkholderia sp. BR10936]|uniref:hypothetical protein n=1 Tax=Paraburkholderia sp. BR10936 TaxID=3236993 RepID=UPI0034D1E50F
MNRELENALVARHPALYRSLEPRYSGACRFECDDGWYRIIDELSGKLETEARLADLQVVCVKEKLGSLRVYLRGSVTGRVQDWVATAEGLSLNTCERCSRAAMLRRHKDGGGIRTLCPTCAAAMDYVIE